MVAAILKTLNGVITVNIHTILRPLVGKSTGKPNDWVPHHLHGSESKDLQAVSKSPSDSSSELSFTKAQFAHLGKLFASSWSSLMTHGTALSSLVDLAIPGKPWIIDSSASDHMTGIRSFFVIILPIMVIGW